MIFYIHLAQFSGQNLGWLTGAGGVGGRLQGHGGYGHASWDGGLSTFSGLGSTQNSQPGS